MKILILTFLSLLLVQAPAFSQFTRITNTPIVTDARESSGLAWIDYDNDGDDDLFVTVSSGPGSPNSSDLLYQNNGDGTFTRILVGDEVNENGTGRSSTWGDFNNDGYIDLFVVNQLETTLYRNSAAGFIKINSIPTTPLSFSYGNDHSGAAWGDFDGDGYLDLYLASYQLAANSRNVLYMNNKDGSFTQVPDTSPVTTIGYSMTPSLIDYNLDGRLDIVVPNYSTTTAFLYANQGNGIFNSIANASGLVNISAQGASFADYDNDGDFDVLFNVNYNTSNQFFENNGDGTFSSKTIAPSSKLLAAATAWGDYNNDGFIDVILVGAYPFPGGTGTEGKTMLFKNNGDKTFTDVSADQGMVSGFYSWAVAWSDYDKDGFLDVLVGNRSGNNLPINNVLYKNSSNGNNWINLKLTGKNSNRSAIGTNVRIKTGGKLQSRTIQASTGTNSQNSLNVHFGIGKSEKIDTMLIEWPLRGTQEIFNQAKNQFLQITEIDFPAGPSGLTTISNFTDATLTWTDNSINETGFRIERSKGKSNNFKFLATVPANTTTYKDQGAPTAEYYYRVTATVADGVSTYSNISSGVVITGLGERSESNMTVYPNPVVHDLHIVPNGQAIGTTARLFNSFGQHIANFDLASEHEVISLSYLSPGIYLLRLGSESMTILKK